MTSILEIQPEMTGPQKATVAMLQRSGAVIPHLSKQELTVLWEQLKDTEFLWELVNVASDHPDDESAQGYLRLMAFFRMAGKRVERTWLQPHANECITVLAFLLKVYRALPDYLPSGSWGYDYVFWKSCVRQCVQDHVGSMPIKAPDVELHINQEFWTTSIADISWIIRSARQSSFGRIDDLRRYLRDNSLLPEDLGFTMAELEDWLHEELIELARSKFSFCRPNPGYDERLIYENIAGGLLALSRGVTLAEAGIGRGEFAMMRNVLNVWLEEARKNPRDYHVSLHGITTFRDQVMPLFDWILRKESAATLTH